MLTLFEPTVTFKFLYRKILTVLNAGLFDAGGTADSLLTVLTYAAYRSAVASWMCVKLKLPRWY